MRSGAALLGLLLFALATTVAHAEPPTPGSAAPLKPDRPNTVETNVVATDAGVVIYVGIRSTTPGSPGSPGGNETISAPTPPVCSATAVNISAQSTEGGWLAEGLHEHPGTIPFAVTCDDHLTIAWVPIGSPGDPDIVVELLPEDPADPTAIAAALLGIVPVPPVQVGANPDTGLVAMSSWYWVEGYDGSTLSGSETLGDTTVEVRIRPERYEWAFGDGATLTTTSLGRQYPAESDVQHIYERAADPYQVRLVIVFSAEFRVITEEPDGEGGTVTVVGDWQDAGPIERSFTRPYVVQQVQSVLTAQ